MRRIIVFGLISLVILAFLSAYHLVRETDNKFHMVFCNVGQGDGILLRSPRGIDIIVDGGPGENGLTDCLDRHLPFWDRDIDIVILTHPDADHLTGLVNLVKTYNIGKFMTSQAPKETEVYKELMQELGDKKIKVYWSYKGDVVKTSDGMVITTLWPTTQFVNSKSDETNDYSLVHLVKFGKFQSLLTGDIPSVYLNSIIPLIDYIDIIKPPHHGSKTGIDEFTFQHLIPKYAVISAGKNNRYHHPSSEVIEILNRLKISYTDTLGGDVEITSDGNSWSFK